MNIYEERNVYQYEMKRLQIKRQSQVWVTNTVISLYASITENTVKYFWKLENKHNHHFWFTEIQPDTFRMIKNRLDREYRFRWFPIRQESPKAAKVAQYNYYL